MEFIDYYETMGVDENASASDIKRAYRKLARMYHPDVSKEAHSEEKFKAVGEAYNVLKDPEKRREYDELRLYQQSGQSAGGGFQPPPGWQARAKPEDFNAGDHPEFSEFFEQVFGSRVRDGSAFHVNQRANVSGQDLHSSIQISLRDAFAGSSVSLALKVPSIRADGSVFQVEKNLKVKVPRGVIDGQKIRLRGQGAPGIGQGKAGDLYIELRIRDDDTYHVDGRDVSVTVPIMPWDAALGTVLEVPTLSGPVNLTVPANVSLDKRLRLEGRGLPGSPPGDQYVQLKLELPKATSDAQIAIYESMKALWCNDPDATKETRDE